MKKYRSHFSIKEAEFTIASDMKNAILPLQSRAGELYEEVEAFGDKYPDFLGSFSPTTFAREDALAPEVAKRMEQVTRPFTVGPMAAVAGVIADLLFEEGLACNPKFLLIEDGGEIMVKCTETVIIGLYAGEQGLKSNIGFQVAPETMPLGVGTSSATIGHAISLGEADVATVFAINAGIADAAATYFGNLVKGEDVPRSISRALSCFPHVRTEGVKGVFIARGSHVGTSGDLPKLIKVSGTPEDLIKRKNSVILQGNEEVL